MSAPALPGAPDAKPAKAKSPTQRLIRSAPWAIADGLITILYSLGVVIVVGRTVTPAEFGLASVALALVMVVEVVSSAGLEEAVIQFPTGHTRVTDTAFTVGMALAIAGALVSIGLAFPISWAYGEPRLVELVAVASGIIIGNAAFRVPSAVLARKMRAQALTKRTAVGRITGLLVLIVTAFADWGAWSIVLAMLVTSWASLVAVLWQMARLPRIGFDRGYAVRLLRYGGLVSLDKLFWNITSRVFALLYGYYHGVAAVGIFQFALRLVDEVANLLLIVVTRFGLSFFSERERSGSDTSSAFLKGTRLLNTVAAPVFAGIALTANDFVPLLFGDRWIPAVPIIWVVAFGWFLGFPRTLIPAVLRSKQVQAPLLRYSAVTSAFVLLACVVTSSLSPVAASFAWASRQIYSVPWGLLIVRRYLKVPVMTQIRQVLPSACAVGVMAIAVVAMDYFMPLGSHLLELVRSVVVGAVAYALAVLLFDRSEIALLLSLIRQFRGRA